MQIDKAQILKEEVLTVNLFIAQYCPGVTPQSLYYAMNNDLIDWCNLGGRDRYVVISEKTKAYVPNENKNRTIMHL